MPAKTYSILAATNAAQKLIFDIEQLERQANELGLYPAARALNNAKNAAGWQLAGDLTQADAASTRRM